MMKVAVEVTTYGEKKEKEVKHNQAERVLGKDNINSRQENSKRCSMAQWDEECNKMLEDRKIALKRFCKNMSNENFIEYKKRRAIARKTIRTKKREEFKEFVSRLNKNFSLTYVWKKMRIFKNSFNTVEWNKWQEKNREVIARNEADNLSPQWVEFEDINKEIYRIRDSILDKKLIGWNLKAP